MNFKRQPFLKMFAKKRNRNNNGVIWASIISLGLSALVMGFGKGQGRRTESNGNFTRKTNLTPMFQNLIKNFMSRNGTDPLMNNAALNEFSDELISKTIQNDQQRYTPQSNMQSNFNEPNKTPKTGAENL